MKPITRPSSLAWHTRQGRAVLSAAVGGISLATSLALAVDRTWTSSTDRFFSDPNAWSGAAIRSSGDNARFTLANAYSVLFITSPTNQLASFSDGTVTFDLGGQAYSLSSTSSVSLTVGTLRLFGTASARLNLGGTGTLQDQSVSVGNFNGPGTISAGSVLWNTAGTLTIGNGGPGSVNLNAGAVVTTANATLGAASAGSGTLIIGSGGSFKVTASSFDIGSLGVGNVTINPGGFLNCGSFNATMYLGHEAGSSGTVNLSGGSWSTVLSTAGGIVNVGYSGAGAINASSGTLSCRVIHLGANSGSAGSLNLSGSARLTTSGVGIGGTAGPGSVAGGSAQLNVSGGTLNGGQMWLWPGGAINLNGGTLAVTQIFGNGGNFTWTSGCYAPASGLIISPSGLFPTLTLDAGKTLLGPSLTVGDNSGGGTVSFINSSCTVPMTIIHRSAVTVNNALATLSSLGDGSLTVSSGTLVLSAGAFIGGNAASANLSQSHLIASSSLGVLTVGQNGAVGTLPLSNGTTASFQQFTLTDDGFVQIDASTWTGTSASTLNVGLGAPGTLVLRNGAVFEIGNASLGLLAGVGNVTVADADSSWTVGNGTNTGNLIIGRGGGGSLGITSGAHVNAITGSLGQLAGSGGSVLLDAAGLSFQQDLHVGEAGIGSLTVSGGGSLQCGHGYVGTTGNGVGTVILSGAGSSWTGTAGLDIGGGQSCWFTLGPGTSLTPGGSINVGANGVFDYAGGALGTTSLVLDAGRIRGSGVFAYPVTNSSGVIEVNSSTLTFTSSVTNSGGSTLTKIGGGAAEMASYVSAGAGSVIVNDGILNIGSDLGPVGNAAHVSVNQSQAVLNLGATQHLTDMNIAGGSIFCRTPRAFW